MPHRELKKFKKKKKKKKKNLSTNFIIKICLFAHAMLPLGLHAPMLHDNRHHHQVFQCISIIVVLKAQFVSHCCIVKST
jgi:hypothetical protein